MFMLLLAELLNILTGNLKCQLYFCTCTYNAVKLEKINKQYMQYLVLFFGGFFGKLYVSPGSTKESL